MSQESENLQWRIRQSLGEFNDDTTPVVLLCYNLSGRLKAALSQQSAVTDDMRYAVRFAPSSAHWSERLLELFGPDARKGIDALEAQLREALSQQEAGLVNGCILCANGNDLPEGEYCRGCGRENNLSPLGRAVRIARGSESVPSVKVEFAAPKPAPLPQPDLYKCRNCEWQGRDLNMHEGLCSDLYMETLLLPVASVPQDEWTFDELDLRGPGDFMTTPPEGWESSDWRTCLELKAELHNKRVYRAEIKRLRALIANRDSTQSGPQDEQDICQCTADESTGWTQWPVCNVCSKIVEGVELSQGAEIQRLTECLQKANIQAEHFEREWYLRGDEIEKLKSVPQDVEEFIANNAETFDDGFGEWVFAIRCDNLRAWMAGHARAPVESSDIEIEFEWSSKGKAIFCRDGTYFALKPEEFPAMHKAMLTASKERTE